MCVPILLDPTATTTAPPPASPSTLLTHSLFLWWLSLPHLALYLRWNEREGGEEARAREENNGCCGVGRRESRGAARAVRSETDGWWGGWSGDVTVARPCSLYRVNVTVGSGAPHVSSPRLLPPFFFTVGLAHAAHVAARVALRDMRGPLDSASRAGHATEGWRERPLRYEAVMAREKLPRVPRVIFWNAQVD